MDRDSATLVIDSRCRLGEGPCWDRDSESLLWVDIEAKQILRWDGAGPTITYGVEERVGAVAPRTGGGWVAAVESGFVLLNAAGEPERLIPVEAERLQHRMNDGCVDHLGRFWAGTMHLDLARGAGSLYRLDPDGEVERVLDGLTLSNGLDWSPDGDQMFFVDSLTGRVDVFDFDEPTGRLSARRPFITFPEDGTLPDGLTVDSEGNVWVAMWDGECVRAWDSSGKLVDQIHVPTRLVTACCFGGPQLNELFITSASIGSRRQPPPSGGVFSASPGQVGQPCRRFAG